MVAYNLFESQIVFDILDHDDYDSACFLTAEIVEATTHDPQRNSHIAIYFFGENDWLEEKKALIDTNGQICSEIFEMLGDDNA